MSPSVVPIQTMAIDLARTIELSRIQPSGRPRRSALVIEALIMGKRTKRQAPGWAVPTPLG